MPRNPFPGDRWFAHDRSLTGRQQRAWMSAFIPRPALWTAAVSTMVLFLAVFVPARTALAGANERGMLILHCNQTLEFTTDGDFNGYSDLYDAKNAVTQVPGDGEGVVYFVLASFDDFAMPQIKGIDFGIELSSNTVMPTLWGPSGWDFFEVPSSDFWPASGTGTGIMWLEPLNRRLNEIYWFVGYAYAGQTVKVTKHPLFGGNFVDAAIPHEKDEIEAYGMLGFGVKGFNPRNEELSANGACCSGSGRCVLQTEDGCRLYPGYNYQGDNTFCSPNPCTPGVGGCCIRAECRMLQWDECVDVRGIFMGEGVGCEPTPCDFSRVETTWGILKSTYRGW